MNEEIIAYNQFQPEEDKVICDELMRIIDQNLKSTESKIWHAHPVWFIDGNPIVGYSKLKTGVRLMFWSGADFGENNLEPGTGKFKDASITYTKSDEIDEDDIKRWLAKSEKIQWDYKHIVKNKGLLKKLD